MTAPVSLPRGLARPRLVPPRGAWARHRELLLELVRRDLKSRYRGSSLGVAWSLLNPLVYMVVYSVVFSAVFRFTPPQGVPYPVYLLSGLLAWNFFSQAVAVSAGSVLGNSSLVKKVAFPWMLLTLSAVLATFVNYLISLALMVPLVWWFHVAVGPPLLVLPLIIAVMFAFAMGIGLIVAAGNVYFRDVEYLVGIALQIGFFMTPVIYLLDNVVNLAHSGKRSAVVFEWVLYANPMTWVVAAFQDAIAYHRWPQHWAGLGYSALVAAIMMGLGLLVFTRLRRRFAEEL